MSRNEAQQKLGAWRVEPPHSKGDAGEQVRALLQRSHAHAE